jgi:hypothetical protein
MKLFGLRYFSIQAENTLFGLPENLTSENLFVYALGQNAKVDYYGKTYTTRLMVQSVSSRYLLGYILKSTDVHLINLDDKLFSEEDIQNWEKVFFMIDQENQIFACQQDYDVATADNIKNVLELLANAPLANFGYVIKLDYIVDKHSFWSIIKTSNGIFQIAFKLNAPNLFGGSKVANAWLRQLKERHNMTSVGVDVRNDNAALRYDQEEMESYRDYADSGGGEWTLTVLQNHKKKKFKSANHLRQKDLEIQNDSPGYILSNIEEVIRKMIDIFKTLND